MIGWLHENRLARTEYQAQKTPAESLSRRWKSFRERARRVELQQAVYGSSEYVEIQSVACGAVECELFGDDEGAMTCLGD